jgi:hypothetical protein
MKGFRINWVRVISELIAAEMFVTLAFVSLGKSNDLRSRLQVTCPFSTSAAPLDRSANFLLPIHPSESSEVREFSRGILKR